MSDGDQPCTGSPRVVVVGARRRRQGLGAHLCRFLTDAGARVVGIVGTSAETIAEARADLASAGITPAGSTDADALIRSLGPDALVVASPSETHDEYLALGLEHGLHVLCEKPLCWGGTDAPGRAHDYAAAFRARGLHLVVNAQWPLTLDAWGDLFPGVLDGSPQSFWMRLSPDSAGEAMLPDALPHALSLLLAVLPHETPVVENVRIGVEAPDASRVQVRFVYRAGSRSVDATVDLQQGTTQPREAGYGFNGLRAWRRVQLEDYRLWLAGGGREVELPDPTPRLVRSFVTRVSSSASVVVDPNAWPSMALLDTIHAAWPDAKAP